MTASGIGHLEPSRRLQRAGRMKFRTQLIHIAVLFLEAAAASCQPCPGNQCQFRHCRGAPCNPSNAGPRWLRCVPDALQRSRVAAAPMVGIRRCIPVFPIVPTVLPCPSDSSSQSSISIGPPSPAERSPRREPSTLPIAAIRLHSAFRIQPQPDGHRRQPCGTAQPTHHASRVPHRLMNPSQRVGWHGPYGHPGGQQTPMQSLLPPLPPADLRNAPSASASRST